MPAGTKKELQSFIGILREAFIPLLNITRLMAEINPKIPIPIYYQLKQLIKEQIEGGELQPGDQIPTEDELCRRYGISRTPVRQALSDLVHEGLLVRTPGRGTFVAKVHPNSGSQDDHRLQLIFSDVRWQELIESAVLKLNKQSAGQSLSMNTLQIPLWDIHDALITAVGRGEAPDISVLDSVWVAEFAHQRYLIPIDEVDPDWHASIQEDYFPAMLAANRYRDHLYGIPVCGDVSVLWYRRDWFEAEGIAPPSTWDELVSAGRHFKNHTTRQRYGLSPYPLAFVGGRRGGETTTYQLLPFLWSGGGELIAGDAVQLDSPATRQALSFLRGLIHQERLAPPEVVEYTWNHSAEVFAAGEVAMALGGTYESFFIRENAGWEEDEFLSRVGFVPIPARAGGEPVTLVGGMNYVLYQQSQAIERSLAMLKMTVEPEIIKPFCVRTGQIPARISIAQELKREDASFVTQTIPLLEKARSRPSIPGFARVSAQFRALVEDCLTGRRSIDDAVSLTAEKISAVTDLPLG